MVCGLIGGRNIEITVYYLGECGVDVTDMNAKLDINPFNHKTFWLA